MTHDPLDAASIIMSLFGTGTIGAANMQRERTPKSRHIEGTSVSDGRLGGGSGRARTPSPPPAPAQMGPGPRLAWGREKQRKMAYTLPGHRGKGDKETLGWSRIPITIFHRILDYALLDFEDDIPVSITNWFYPTITSEPDHHAANIPRFIFLRMRLDDLRLVSEQWKAGVDSHHFWPEYNLGINNSPDTARRSVDLLKNDISQRTPAPLQYPAARHRLLALHQTKLICIPCRLNRPQRRTTLRADHSRCTTHLGVIKVCGHHIGAYCDNCLEVDVRYTLDDANQPLDSDFEPELRFIEDLDTDENGQSRTRCWLCETCRKSALTYQLKRLLIEKCRWEGESHAVNTILNQNALHSTLAAAEYITEGIGTASGAAQNALDEQFLKAHGKWNELEEIAYQLQEHEEIIIRRINRTYKAETPAEAHVRTRRLAELLGRTVIDKDWTERVEQEYKEYWGVHIRRALELRALGDVDVEDEDEFEIVLNSRWWKRLRMGAINHFILPRIRFGFWVCPSDEIAQLSNPSDPPIHASIDTLAKSSEHPFDGDIEFDPDDRPEAKTGNRHDGWINLSSENIPAGADTFLPTPRLARDLEQSFSSRLQGILESAFRELADGIFTQSDSVEEAEKRCADANLDMTLQSLSQKQWWYHSSDFEEQEEAEYAEEAGSAKTNGVLFDAAILDTEDITFVGHNWVSRAGERIGAAKVEGNEAPRIQILVEDQPVADYGIQEIPSSSPPRYETMDESGEIQEAIDTELLSATKEVTHNEDKMEDTALPSSLGKRKEAPEEKAGSAKERKSESLDEESQQVSASDRRDELPVRLSPTFENTSSPALDTPDGDSRKGSSDTSSGPLLLTPNDDSVPMLPDTLYVKETLKSIESREIVESLSTLTDSVTSSAIASPARSLTGVQPRTKILHTTLEDIPWIPMVPVDQLGPGTKAILEEAWSEAVSRFRICGCSICGRRRKMDSWTETDQWSRLGLF